VDKLNVCLEHLNQSLDRTLSEPEDRAAIRVIRLSSGSDTGIVGAANHPTKPQMTVSAILTGDV
jgi:hypothetical protein